MSVWAVNFYGDTDPRDCSSKASGFLSGSPTALGVAEIRQTLETPVEAQAVEARSDCDDVAASRARGPTGAVMDGKGPKTTSIDSVGGKKLDWTPEDKTSVKVGSAGDKERCLCEFGRIDGI